MLWLLLLLLMILIPALAGFATWREIGGTTALDEMPAAELGPQE